MRKKRSVQEISESEFCNFSELALVLDVPRISLYRMQKAFDIFPSTFPVGGAVQMYPVKACTQIYAMYKKLVAEGFRSDAALYKLKKASKQYQKIRNKNY